MKLEDVKILKGKVTTEDPGDIAAFEKLLKDGVQSVTGRIPKDFQIKKVVKVSQADKADATITRVHFSAVGGRLAITCFNQNNVEVQYCYGSYIM